MRRWGVVVAVVAFALALVAVGPARAAKFSTVAATFSWTRVDAYGTWSGGIAMFGPERASLGMLAGEYLIPILRQCTGQGTPSDPSDDTFAEITGESYRPVATAATVMTIAPSLKSASYRGPLRTDFWFVHDGCTDTIIASGTWTKDVQATLIAEDQLTESDFLSKGYSATGTISFDGVPATFIEGQIWRLK